MSILARLKAQPVADKKLFGVVAGPRLGGKTSLAGTLPGKTLMLQAAVLESGSKSAQVLAANNKHDLQVLTFESVSDLQAIIKELREDTTFDHVYVDGLSAITELKNREPAVQVLKKKQIWDGFRAIGEAAEEVFMELKALTYPDVKKPKNVFLTCALKIKTDSNGNISDVELESKGNMAVSSITKLGEAVMTVLPPIQTEEGETGHRLITKTSGFWPGRIDGILSQTNPGTIEPASLATVLDLIKGA